jgi:anthranilate phosphoribosyltransferase
LDFEFLLFKSFGILTDILANRDRSARRDLIVINAAASLIAAEVVEQMESGIKLANEILDSGLAYEKLCEFQRFFRPQRGR